MLGLGQESQVAERRRKGSAAVEGQPAGRGDPSRAGQHLVLGALGDGENFRVGRQHLPGRAQQQVWIALQIASRNDFMVAITAAADREITAPVIEGVAKLRSA